MAYFLAANFEFQACFLCPLLLRSTDSAFLSMCLPKVHLPIERPNLFEAIQKQVERLTKHHHPAHHPTKGTQKYIEMGSDQQTARILEHLFFGNICVDMLILNELRHRRQVRFLLFFNHFFLLA